MSWSRLNQKRQDLNYDIYWKYLIFIINLYKNIYFQNICVFRNIDIQIIKNIWLIIHHSHGILVIINISDLSKSFERIPILIPFLRIKSARILRTIYFYSDWNSGFLNQVWIEKLHVTNYNGKGCICTNFVIRSIRGEYEFIFYNLSWIHYKFLKWNYLI